MSDKHGKMWPTVLSAEEAATVRQSLGLGPTLPRVDRIGWVETIDSCEAAIETALENWANAAPDKRTVNEVIRDTLRVLREAVLVQPERRMGDEVTLCEENHYPAKDGRCPEHGGDACLRQYVQVLRR